MRTLCENARQNLVTHLINCTVFDAVSHNCSHIAAAIEPLMESLFPLLCTIFCLTHLLLSYITIVEITHSHTMTPFDAPGKQAF